MRCADHKGGSKPERTQGLLCEITSQERCTRSARSGDEAHLFGRTDRSLERNVALIRPGLKLETEKRVRVSDNPKDHQGNLLRAISWVNHCELFNFPTNRNNDRSNVRTQDKT